MKKGGRGRVPPNRSSFPLRFLRVLKSSFLRATYDPALIRPPPAFPPSRSASEISKATSCVARFGLPAARAFRASPALGRPSLPHSLVLSLSVPVCLPVCLSIPLPRSLRHPTPPSFLHSVVFHFYPVAFRVVEMPRSTLACFACHFEVHLICGTAKRGILCQRETAY